MYAIIETGGKQYKAMLGQTLMIEKLDAEEGAQVNFDRVMAVIGDDASVKTGVPSVAGAMVTGKVVSHGKGPKIRVFKYKNKVNYRKRYGHRQPFTKVLIEAITGA